MNFSAAQLCKMSAKQLFYLRKHPSKQEPPKQEQIAGVQYQLNVTKSPYVEMATFHEFNNGDRVYFSFDEVQLNEGGTADLIEHKMISNNSPDWYKQQSILQLAIYKMLFLKSNRKLTTAKFAVDKGFPKKALNLVDVKITTILKFGPQVFEVKIKDIEKLRFFLLKKIKASKNWDAAVEFDAKYKHNEWKLLKRYIKYVQV